MTAMRPSTATARADLQEFLDTHLATLDRPQVMDAGCGGAMRIRLPAGAVLNGIDISPESAERNSTLFNIVIGDVQSYPLPRAAFDIVICWELLEHVPHPLAALGNLIAATKPGGFIVLAFPNHASLKGLVTRLSSHKLHVWLLRHFWGQKNAGRPGYAPFPTYMAREIAPRMLEKFLQSQSVEVMFTRLYEGNRVATLRQKAPLLHALYQGFLKLLNALALNSHDFGQSDVLLVLRPRPERQAVLQAA
jgi:SAM-dependent methyltransferase